MHYNQPATAIIRQRYSCRTYQRKPIAAATRQRLADYAAALTSGPFGTRVRFRLLAAGENDGSSLQGLGTYGIIRDPAGFVVGATGDGNRDMEDLGYLLEDLVLYATSLGLGTCWLGGTFNRSAFAARMALRPGERMPAVISVGYPAARPSLVEAVMRRGAGSAKRLSWERLFSDGRCGVALARAAAGEYEQPLEMLRLAPSASNKQPWRIVRESTTLAASGAARWHVYLQRTARYGRVRVGKLSIADLQRVDAGIAMCHFELTAQEAGLKGKWVLEDPGLDRPNALTEYIATWVGM